MKPVIVEPLVGLIDASLRLVAPLTVLNRPTTYRRVPSGDASISVTPPSKVGRKAVSTRPVSRLYEARKRWLYEVVLLLLLLAIDVKPPAMKTRLPITSRSVISPVVMRG